MSSRVLQRVTIAAVAMVCAQSISAKAEGKSRRELSALEINVGRLLPGAAPTSLSVSPDGKRVAYFRKSIDGKKWTLVVDDVEGDPYDGISQNNPLFSLDSRRVAYVAERGSRKLAIIDGREGKEYDAAGDITFSPDSQRVAYMAAQGDERFMILDGSEQALHFDALHASGPIFSPDSQRVGYAAKRGTKWLVVVDGVAGAEYDGTGGLAFSPDSRQWAHFANRGPKSLVVLNGAESAEYDGILRETRLAFTTPHTVEALVHRKLVIMRLVLTDLPK